jgi:hypothetical protein
MVNNVCVMEHESDAGSCEVHVFCYLVKLIF